jgi:hypothetical protein
VEERSIKLLCRDRISKEVKIASEEARRGKRKKERESREERGEDSPFSQGN